MSNQSAGSDNEFADPDFTARRQQARTEVNRLDSGVVHDEPEREEFFNTVYDRANDDAAQIPWADLKPKKQITDWLENNPGEERLALDIACGLGDNAEAISDAGYRTTAFDLSGTAIDWAQQRFGNSKVDYQTANLFAPPDRWLQNFDLVNECYTLQALPPQMLEKTAKAIAALVRPGGSLLIYTRLRGDDQTIKGPPWPLTSGEASGFGKLGFEPVIDHRFEITRGDRIIPHQFAQWRRLD